MQEKNLRCLFKILIAREIDWLSVSYYLHYSESGFQFRWYVGDVAFPSVADQWIVMIYCC